VKNEKMLQAPLHCSKFHSIAKLNVSFNVIKSKLYSLICEHPVCYYDRTVILFPLKLEIKVC
jgi:hypothetical protein